MYSACVPLQLSLIQKNEFSFLKAAEQSTWTHFQFCTNRAHHTLANTQLSDVTLG